LLVEESCDSKSDNEFSSSPLFKLGRSPASVVEATPIFVEDVIATDPKAAVVGLDSVDEEVVVDNEDVAVEVALNSVMGEEVVSVPPFAAIDVTVIAFEAAVAEAARDALTEDEDDWAADVVAVVVFVELGCSLDEVTGTVFFGVGGTTT